MKDKKHYTYLIMYSDGTLYHGVRSCYGEIKDDESYRGSSKVTPYDEFSFKYIMTTHRSRLLASEEEVRYHKEHNVKSDILYRNKANASLLGYDNSKEYWFSHKDYGTVKSTQHELASKYNIDCSHLSKVVSGKRRSGKGWVLGKTPKIINSIYCFSHKDHGTVWSTQCDLIKNFGLDQGSLNKVVLKRFLSCKGWVLGSKIKTIYKTYKFSHKVHGFLETTQSKLVHAFNLDQSTLSKVVKGKTKSTKGWSIIK